MKHQKSFILVYSWILLNYHNVCSLINANLSSNSCRNLFREWNSFSSFHPPKSADYYCPSTKSITPTIYLLYEINAPEGFNLRRDVYIRLAVFLNRLQQKQNQQNIRLVLPPWRRLYHWRSHHLHQDHLPWSRFFDIDSLKRYVNVLDFPEFTSEFRTLYGLNDQFPCIPVHRLIRLEHFKDLLENGVFRDRWQWVKSKDSKEISNIDYTQILRGSYLLEKSLSIQDNRVHRVQFQGRASLLQEMLQEVSTELISSSKDSPLSPQIIALLNAEVVLHDHWSDRNFWLARRSMRFADSLMQVADNFRLLYLNSTNESDRVQRPPMWEYETAKTRGRALGGPYLAVHLRRSDFVNGRKQTTPTLKSTALQIAHHLNELQLKTVFVATDATIFEIKNLRSYLPSGIRFLRFTVNDINRKAELGDGGIAIIDQLICAHGRRFVGTYESTFTYRIYEEREILGFPSDTTFHTFCKQATMEGCEKNSAWPIVY